MVPLSGLKIGLYIIGVVTFVVGLTNLLLAIVSLNHCFTSSCTNVSVRIVAGVVSITAAIALLDGLKNESAKLIRGYTMIMCINVAIYITLASINFASGDAGLGYMFLIEACLVLSAASISYKLYKHWFLLRTESMPSRSGPNLSPHADYQYNRPGEPLPNPSLPGYTTTPRQSVSGYPLQSEPAPAYPTCSHPIPVVSGVSQSSLSDQSCSHQPQLGFQMPSSSTEQADQINKNSSHFTDPPPPYSGPKY